jgi:hypothetical protein
MSKPDDTEDFGVVDPSALTHELLAKFTDNKVREVREAVTQIQGTVTELEDKVDHLTHKVDHLIGELGGLSRSIALLPTGITLVNAVGQILETVQEIKQQV